MYNKKFGVSIDDIQKAIDKGFPLLRFVRSLERHFEEDVSKERCRQMIVINYIGLAIYHCFLPSDYLVIGDVFHLDLFVHFFITTPVVIGTNLVLSRHPPVWVREGVETFAALVVAATIVVVTTASRLPDRDVVHNAVMLVVLCLVTMQRVRFPYAVAGCAIMSLLFAYGLMTMSYSVDRMVMANSVFLCVVLFTLVGGYTLEYEHRMGYLLRAREQLRNQDLEVVSLCDALTGIGNRRALDAALVRLVEHRTGAAVPVAVLLLDVDHFKLFNDTNGHQAGDVCLQRIARLVAASLRDGEGAAYRFGGEEFLVLIEGVTLSAALDVAGRIRANVEQAAIPRGDHMQNVVSVSVGVAQGVLGEDTTPATLIDLADRALYSAKDAGRNRVFPEPAGTVAMHDRRKAG